MTSVCFYFQMHQPHRLRRYSVFDTEPTYFDTFRNGEIARAVAQRCYNPATQLLSDLIARHDDRFRFSISITGVLADQLRKHSPDTIKHLQKLAATGCVEFLSEPYHHSLSFLYSRDEFAQQVDRHTAMIEELFDQTPRVFRNAELIYNNDLAYYIAQMGRFDGIIAEGADAILGKRSARHVYRPPNADGLRVLLKHYRLSDDIAFRFSDRGWSEWPLRAEKYIEWLRRGDAEGPLVNLFLDMETFGEHQTAESGVFDFLAALPKELLKDKKSKFVTVSEALKVEDPVDDFDVPHMISWADTERDLSAWLGNAMQSNALHELYKLEQPIKQSADVTLLEDWRRLSTSDHFYYMCTKYFADGDVHKYFNPYESPYDSYINFMNVLDNVRSRAGSV